MCSKKTFFPAFGDAGLKMVAGTFFNSFRHDTIAMMDIKPSVIKIIVKNGNNFILICSFGKI